MCRQPTAIGHRAVVDPQDAAVLQDPFVAEILARRAALAEAFAPLEAKGWRLKGLGAYFAYVEHPFAMGAADLAPLLVREAGVLILPATMFTPPEDPSGDRHFRIAFANAGAESLRVLCTRLAALDLPPLQPL